MTTPAAATPRSLLGDLRALPRPFWILAAGTFINRLGTFVWPFLTIYLTRQGHSVGAVAWAVGSFGIGSFFGGAIGGWCTDRYGRRNVIAIGSAASACCVLLLYAASSFPAVIACTILIGLAGGTYHPAASALLVDVVPPDLRLRAYAMLRLALNAGFACGAALGGVLANYSFAWLFVGDAVTTFIYSLIAILALPHGLRGQTKQAPLSVALGHIRRDRAFHSLFLAAFLSTLIFAQFGSTYSLYVTHSGISLGLLGWLARPEAVYGLLLGWNGLFVTCAELPLTRWSQRFSVRPTMAAGYFLLGGGFFLNLFASDFASLFLAMTIFTIGEMVATPIAHAYLALLAPESLRGRYMGAMELAHSLGAIIGPALGAQLYQCGPLALWGGCGLIGILSALVILGSASAANAPGTVRVAQS